MADVTPESAGQLFNVAAEVDLGKYKIICQTMQRVKIRQLSLLAIKSCVRRMQLQPVRTNQWMMIKKSPEHVLAQ